MTELMTVVFIAGLVLVSFGAWLVYEPAGFMAAGALLVSVSVLWVRGQMRERG